MYFDILGKPLKIKEFDGLKKEALLKKATELYWKVYEYESTIKLLTHQSVSLINEHNRLKLQYMDLKERGISNG